MLTCLVEFCQKKIGLKKCQLRFRVPQIGVCDTSSSD